MTPAAPRPPDRRPVSYFNYFTEIEDHFRRARGSGLFLLSPLDWALIETWKDAGVPLEAVLRGIDRAFEKWHARKRRFRMVNSVAYCAQEVLEAARLMAENRPSAESGAEPAFDPAELAEYFSQNAAALRAALPLFVEGRGAVEQTIASLEELRTAALAGELHDMEAVEQRLTVMEERLIGAAMQSVTEDELLACRREMDRSLAAYRGKMTADQIALLERQYMRRRRLEELNLPRLSLFYMR